jgi:hypothetical protein
LNYGNYFFVPPAVTPTFDYQVRIYQANILTQLPALNTALNKKPENQNAPVSVQNPKVVC